jgi:hypothetical protein
LLKLDFKEIAQSDLKTSKQYAEEEKRRREVAFSARARMKLMEQAAQEGLSYPVGTTWWPGLAPLRKHERKMVLDSMLEIRLGEGTRGA